MQHLIIDSLDSKVEVGEQDVRDISAPLCMKKKRGDQGGERGKRGRYPSWRDLGTVWSWDLCHWRVVL